MVTKKWYLPVLSYGDMGGYPACCNMGGYRKGNYRPLKAGCMAPEPKAKGKGKTPAAAPAAAPVAEPPAKKAKGKAAAEHGSATIAKAGGSGTLCLFQAHLQLHSGDWIRACFAQLYSVLVCLTHCSAQLHFVCW